MDRKSNICTLPLWFFFIYYIFCHLWVNIFRFAQGRPTNHWEFTSGIRNRWSTGFELYILTLLPTRQNLMVHQWHASKYPHHVLLYRYLIRVPSTICTLFLQTLNPKPPLLLPKDQKTFITWIGVWVKSGKPRNCFRFPSKWHTWLN